MCIVAQWFQRRRAQRQLLEERKKHEAETQAQREKHEAETQAQREKHEAETQAQREKQDYEYGRVLQVMFQSLQDVMDPLISSQAYNNRFCPLTRLPDELLLNVLDFLYGDHVTLYCLRWTSRIFFRLLHQHSGFWTVHIRAELPCTMGCRERLQLRRLLIKDGRCENCRHWNAQQRHLVQPCRFGRSFLREKPVFLGCEYWFTDYKRPHCSACDTDHDSCQFPMAYRTLPKHQDLRPGMCLGQLGSVKLCEHVYITWATIKAHIDAWRRQSGYGRSCAESDWKTCIESFSIECHDATHDIRCTDSEAPSWPRARLDTTSGVFGWEDHDYVVLYLEWSPHGRLDSLTPTADGQIPAEELRSLFRKFRRLGPADTFYPPGFPETLPEMACFGRDFPIYYKMGEEKHVVNQTPPPSLSPSSFLDQRKLSDRCRGLQGLSRIGCNSRRLDISSHYLSGASGHGIVCQCLLVTYQKGIVICHTRDLANPTVKLVPSDPWLHAMDIGTYPHQEARQFRPLCRDASCKNYYRRPKDHQACYWPL